MGINAAPDMAANIEPSANASVFIFVGLMPVTAAACLSWLVARNARDRSKCAAGKYKKREYQHNAYHHSECTVTKDVDGPKVEIRHRYLRTL